MTLPTLTNLPGTASAGFPVLKGQEPPWLPTRTGGGLKEHVLVSLEDAYLPSLSKARCAGPGVMAGREETGGAGAAAGNTAGPVSTGREALALRGLILLLNGKALPRPSPPLQQGLCFYFLRKFLEFY